MISLTFVSNKNLLIYHRTLRIVLSLFSLETTRNRYTRGSYVRICGRVRRMPWQVILVTLCYERVLHLIGYS
jgi:hypothetical protein